MHCSQPWLSNSSLPPVDDEPVGLQFKGNKHITDYPNFAQFWDRPPVVFTFRLFFVHQCRWPVETLQSSKHKWVTQSQVGHDSGNKKSPSRDTNPTKARHWGTMTSLCQVHLPSAWCTVRRLWVNHNIHLGVEHVGDTILLPSQGQEAFSWRWPGPPDSEICSCASDSDWRFRFMPSKRQSESPKLVAIADEGNCRFGYYFLGMSHKSHKGKWVRVLREFHNVPTFGAKTFCHVQRHTSKKT